MDTRYQPIYQQAAHLQHAFHDYTHHAANDPMANILRKEIHELTNDLAVGKNPLTVENRLKTIQKQIKQTQVRNPVMAGAEHNPILNNQQSVHLTHDFEHMRQQLHHGW